MLESRYEPKRTVIFHELDEFGEIIFVYKGSTVIGYEINKQQRYCIKFVDNCVIGAYGVTFNQRSAFIYTAMTNIHAFTVRKRNWLKLLSSHPDLGKLMKQNVLLHYLTKIRSKVIIKKRQFIAKMYERNDHQMIQ